MSKSKIFYITAGSLIIFGIFLYFVGFSMGGLVTGISISNGGIRITSPDSYYEGSSGKKIVKYEEKEMALDAFTDLQIYVNFSDVKIVPSDHYGVSLGEFTSDPFTFERAGSLLMIKQKSKSSHFGITLFGMAPTLGNNKDCYLTLYVPEDAVLGSVEIDADTGEISMNGLSPASLALNGDFGDVTLSDITSSSIDVDLDTGNLDIKQFKAGTLNFSGDFSDLNLSDGLVTGDTVLSMSTGSAILDRMAFEDLSVTSSFGDVSSKNISVGGLDVSLDTGSCNLIVTAIDSAEISSDFGDISLSLPDTASSYRFDLATDFGDVAINRSNLGSKYQSIEAGSTAKPVGITCSTGSIIIKDSAQ